MADSEPYAEPEPTSLSLAKTLVNSTLTEDEMANMAPMDNLLPALLQIFLTVALGWIAGSLKMFGSKEARGLGLFVGKFSLPALIFVSLASLNLSNIKWSFLLSILISKSIIFFLVLLLDFFINKNLSRSALFAIYSTQTNDFGMGLPILTSVFGPDHELVGLLYLVAPISLLILNPIGFVILEVGRGKTEKTNGPFATLLGVFKGLVTNPVVAMTVLGVLGNLVFSSSPPVYLTKFLSALGAAFSALAPFSLGLSMAGKLSGIQGDIIKPIIALVTTKSIVTPLLTYTVVNQMTLLLDGSSDPSLSNFALLLGSFPTALGVVSYAAEYEVCPDLISAAIVLGTLVSAPLMYLIANILTAVSESPEALARSDHSWIDCIISIVSCLIIIGIFFYQSRWRHPPHLLTMSMLLLTLLSSTTGLIAAYIHIPILALLHLAALHASRLSTAFLAMYLLSLSRSSTSFSSPLIIMLFIISGPILSLVTFLLLLTPYSPSHFLSFGPIQDQLGLVINFVSLLPTLICLFLLKKTSYSSLPGVQMFRHSLLLLILAAAMFISIALSLIRILPHKVTYPGALTVIVCLNSVFSSGQGLLFLAVFGMDQVGKLFVPFQNLLTSWLKRGGADTFVMVNSTDGSSGAEINDNDISLDNKDMWLGKESKISIPDNGRSV